MENPIILQMQGITKLFPGVRALDDVSLKVHKGTILAICGENGAGKSTLMNSLAGTLTVDQGDILLEGKSIKNVPAAKRAKDIARVFQDPKMGTASRLTIEENMAIAAAYPVVCLGV